MKTNSHRIISGYISGFLSVMLVCHMLNTSLFIIIQVRSLVVYFTNYSLPWLCLRLLSHFCSGCLLDSRIESLFCFSRAYANSRSWACFFPFFFLLLGVIVEKVATSVNRLCCDWIILPRSWVLYKSF